jgi:hypothetical protein
VASTEWMQREANQANQHSAGKRKTASGHASLLSC